jgi:predicted extracellular nuclease
VNFRIFFTDFLVCVGFACYSQPQQSALPVTIGFYNVENLFDTDDDPATKDSEFLPDGLNQWSQERYLHKLANISKVIAAMNVDVIGLAEIENRKVLEDLVIHPNIANKRYQIAHFDMRDERGIDVALLYKPSVFKVFSVHHKLIIDAAEPDFKTRDILWVKGLFQGDTLHVAVNHWPSRSGGKEDKRLIAAQTLRHAVDSVLRVNLKSNIVIMGDLNDDPNNKSVKKILMASDSKEKKYTLINTSEPTFKQGYGTLAYNGIWNLFDQIIISSSLQDGVGSEYVSESFTVFAPKWMQESTGKYEGMPMRTFRGPEYNPEGYSDHFPVFIRIQKK